MHVHLADAAKPAVTIRAARLEPTHAKYLISYAYRAGLEDGYGALIRDFAARGVRARLLLDSGAFTAFTTGRRFTVEGYADWVWTVKAALGTHLESLEYLNLDVIGDQAATWANQTALERLGLNPVPILTHTSTDHDLERILGRPYPYFALGGLVALRGDKEAVTTWLDRVYKRLLEHRRKSGTLVKTHLLGCTWQWLLMRYPAYSSDSSTWMHPIRYGKHANSRLPFIPKARVDGDLTPQIHALRCEIQTVKTLESDTTRLWEARGITWRQP
jgi:hypothetical protein